MKPQRITQKLQRATAVVEQVCFNVVAVVTPLVKSRCSFAGAYINRYSLCMSRHKQNACYDVLDAVERRNRVYDL